MNLGIHSLLVSMFTVASSSNESATCTLDVMLLALNIYSRWNRTIDIGAYTYTLIVRYS